MENHVSRLSQLAAPFLALCLHANAWALADDATVIVTATRTATRASTVLSDTSVIDRAQIERAGQSTLTELLQSQPGVQITANGGPGSVSAVSLRGGSSTQVLVLLDGQRLSSATTGSTALENIPLNAIERIEILRGPASALYGADAMAGVIQIFTRNGTGAPRLTAELAGGSYDTATGSVNYGGGIGATRFNVNLGYERSGSFSATRPGAFGFNPDRDPYNNGNVSAQLAQQLSPAAEIGTQLFYSRGKTHFDAANCDAAFNCSNAFDNRLTQNLSSYSVYGRYRFRPNWTSQLRLGQSRDDSTALYLDPSLGVVNNQNYRTRQDQFSWQNDLSLDGGKLMLLAERRKEMVDSNAVAYTLGGRTTDALVAGYQAWLGAHTLQASARHDSISQLGDHNTGSLAYGYQLTPAWRGSASVGTAFRAPTFNDLYWPVDFSTFYVGNPGLRPERARNREAGLVYAESRTRFALTAFNNRVSDLISFADAAAPAFFFTTVNVGSAVLKGVSTSYAGESGPWKLDANYDYLDARDQNTGRFLIRRARNHGTLGLRYGVGPWEGGAQLVASGPRWANVANTRRLGGYGLINADASYRMTPSWSLFGRLGNLFDKKYELVQDFATPGASIMLGLRYSEH